MLPFVTNDPWLSPVAQAVDDRHNPDSPLLLGEVLPTDTIKPSRQVSLLDREMELFSMYNLKTTQP